MRLEAGEHFTNLIGGSEIRKSIGNGVLVFQPEQGSELDLVKLFDANAHVM